MTNIGTKYILAQKFIFDPYSNTLNDLNDDNESVRLGSNESRILLILIENSNQVVSRDQLHEYVWREQGFQVDDSSLTQAISTLRKMLKDSTKSPQFVKTVPKRGYQLISTVKIAPTTSKETDTSLDTTAEAPAQEVNPIHQAPVTPVSDPVASNPPKSVIRSNKPLPPWLYAIWAFTIIIPIFFWLKDAPDTKDLLQVPVDSDIPLFIPANQPDIEEWLPVIEKCTATYQKIEPTPLVKVIATAGDNKERISLNYIYDLDNTDKNKTFVLFVNQTNFESLCQ